MRRVYAFEVTVDEEGHDDIVLFHYSDGVKVEITNFVLGNDTAILEALYPIFGAVLDCVAREVRDENGEPMLQVEG